MCVCVCVCVYQSMLIAVETEWAKLFTNVILQTRLFHIVHLSLTKLTRTDLPAGIWRQARDFFVVLEVFIVILRELSIAECLMYSSHTRLLALTIVVVAAKHIGFESRYLVLKLILPKWCHFYVNSRFSMMMRKHLVCTANPYLLYSL